MHKASCWANLQSFGPSFFSIMTKLNSLARARVIGPEGGAGAGVGEGAASVDVIMVSSSARVQAFVAKQRRGRRGTWRYSACADTAGGRRGRGPARERGHATCEGCAGSKANLGCARPRECGLWTAGRRGGDLGVRAPGADRGARGPSRRAGWRSGARCQCNVAVFVLFNNV
jgi:hypothetical protein